MIRQLVGALTTIVFSGAAVVAPSEPQETRHLMAAGVTVRFVDPSPSPTLGSTPQPDLASGDDNDGNWSDYTQVPLAVVAPLTVAVVVGGSVLFYLIRRTRRTRTDDSSSDGGGSGDS
jgi:hypothetical protein